MNPAANVKLMRNIKNSFGKKGEVWLINLPDIIQTLTSYWHLSSINPVDNMTYHYVAKVLHKGQPAVLKIGCDEQTWLEEKNALNYFNGHASIKLLQYNQESNALLLQQAIPGDSLKSFYPKQADFVISCYADVLKKLHSKKFYPQANCQSINGWLVALDKISPDKFPGDLLRKAIEVKNKLLASSLSQILLHGDLHHDNVLKHGDHWLTIDPKGVIGEPEFEVAAFDFIHKTELNSVELKNIFTQRINSIVEKSNLNAQRIKDWVLVRLILSAAWSIEDNGNPDWVIQLANKLHTIEY